MWSGGISKRNRVRPAGKWARGLTCQTAKTPACHIQFVNASIFIFGHTFKSCRHIRDNKLFHLFECQQVF